MTRGDETVLFEITSVPSILLQAGEIISSQGAIYD